MSQKTRDNSIGEEGRKKKKEEKMERERERERDGLGESWGGKGEIGGRKVTPSDTRMRNGTAFRGGRRSEWANNFASLCS